MSAAAAHLPDPGPALRPTSVYVHFPWCLKKCPYCDFATERIDRDDLPHAAYADAVLRELDGQRGRLDGRRLVSVFFGGGTPSLWAPREVGRVLTGIRRAFSEEEPDLEVTAECNPTSLDAAQAEGLVAAGIGRVSIGVQSLEDGRLRTLGRLHDARGAIEAVATAVGRVPRVSADLMFGVPGQTPDDLAAEVRRLVDLGVGHVSAYALTIEPGTRFGELHRKGRLTVATDDTYADLYERAEATFEALGFAHYEVSNYARPGQEARHNQHYWRGGDYLGLGAAAVGCLTRSPGVAERRRGEPDPRRYLQGGGSSLAETLGPDELVREALMLGLRTAEGVDLPETGRRAGVADPLRGRERAVHRRVARGDLLYDPAAGRLRVPRPRWLALDGIVADLF